MKTTAYTSMKTPFLIFDTEFTSWDGAMARNWSGPGERREIVQIAAIKVDHDFNSVAVFDQLVKPVFNPILSDYFVDLTGITQEQVDEFGVSYREAIRGFEAFKENMTAWSYGRDEEVLQENADWFDLPFTKQGYCNVVDIVSEAGHNPRQWTSGTLYKLAGVEQPGNREHNAADDCLSILTFLRNLHRQRMQTATR